MKLLDSKGRLFGKINVLDLGAILVIILVFVGIFLVPGTGGSIAQVKNTKSLEVDVVVRGLSIRSPDQLIQELQTKKKVNIIIRNQPYGEVGIKSVQQLPRTVVATQPDGSVKELPDPKVNSLVMDMIITLVGQAQITPNGPVFGNNKVKIGTPLELEGYDYDFNSTVIDVRVQP